MIGHYELLLYVGMASQIGTIRMVTIGLAKIFNSLCPSVRKASRIVALIFHAMWNVRFIMVGFEVIVFVMYDYSVIEL